jgi:hypothetical protein
MYTELKITRMSCLKIKITVTGWKLFQLQQRICWLTGQVRWQKTIFAMQALSPKLDSVTRQLVQGCVDIT